MIVIRVHGAHSSLTLLDFFGQAREETIKVAVELKPGVLALGHTLVSVLKVELEEWQLCEEALDEMVVDNHLSHCLSVDLDEDVLIGVTTACEKAHL